jgi:hypothetical protein
LRALREEGGVIDLGLYGTTCTASDKPAPTAAEIIFKMNESLRELESVRDRVGGSLLNSVRVIESQYLDYQIPVREHFRRRTQSERYHRRIQKKWIKRFGRKPCDHVFIFSDPMYGQGIVASPQHVAMIKTLTGALK